MEKEMAVRGEDRDKRKAVRQFNLAFHEVLISAFSVGVPVSEISPSVTRPSLPCIAGFFFPNKSDTMALVVCAIVCLPSHSGYTATHPAEQNSHKIPMETQPV